MICRCCWFGIQEFEFGWRLRPLSFGVDDDVYNDSLSMALIGEVCNADHNDDCP